MGDFGEGLIVGSVADLSLAPPGPPGTMSSSNNAVIVNALIGVGILVAFCLAGVLTKSVYFYLIRYCTKIQRWKSVEKLERILDVYDHVSHNTFSNAHRDDGADGVSRANFYSSGFDLGGMTPRMNGSNGVRVEVDSLARETSVYPGQGASNAISFGRYHSISETMSTEDIWKRDKKRGWLTRKIKKFFGFLSKKKRRKRVYEDFYFKEQRQQQNQQQQQPYLSNSGADYDPFPYGFSFDDHHWVPVDIEGRSCFKFIRGNMLTIVGSFIFLTFFIVGFFLAIYMAQVDLSSAITGTALMTIVAFFKVADFLYPVIAYFMILFTDAVERGTLVEVSPSMGGLNGNIQGISLVGVVMDITSTHVSMLCTRAYNTWTNTNGSNALLGMDGSLITVTSAMNENHKPVTATSATSTTSKPSVSKAQPAQSSFAPIGVNTCITHGIVGRECHKCKEFGIDRKRVFIEKDFFKTRYVAKVPTNAFLSAYLGVQTSWYPVANLQRLRTDLLTEVL